MSLPRYQVESARWIEDATHSIRVEGWRVEPDFAELTEISAWQRGTRVAAAPVHERNDVFTFFDRIPGSQRSGFHLVLPLIDPDEPVELRAHTRDKTSPFFNFLPRDLPGRNPMVRNYPSWRQQLNASDRDHHIWLSHRTAEIDTAITFSFIVPVYDPPLAFLCDCLDSMRRQTYPHWEARIIDDGSTNPQVRDTLARASREDKRIHVEYLPSNQNISRASNAALASAEGKFVVFLDHDDKVHPHALAELAVRLADEPDLDILYSDEEKIGQDNQPVLPFLKPGPSLIFAKGVMYIGHLLCVRTALARAVDGFDPEFDGIQDYEFFLRLAERTTRIAHVDRILYQWRMSPKSSALSGNIKGDMDSLQARAVQRHLDRIGFPARARALGGHRVRLEPHTSPGLTDLAIVAPSSEFIPKIASGTPRIVIAPFQRAEWQSAILNVSEKFVVLLRSPVQAVHDRWLDTLRMHLSSPHCGLVGPLLLSGVDCVHASGLIACGKGNWTAAMRGFPASGDGYNGSLACDREVSGLPSDCVAFRKELGRAALATGIDPTGDDFGTRLAEYVRSYGLSVVVSAGAPLRLVHPLLEPRRQPLEVGDCRGHDPCYPAYMDPLFGDYRLGAPIHPNTPPIRFYIDRPTSWKLPGQCLIIKGWAFAAQRTHLAGLRACVGGLNFPAALHLPRPDVLASRADAPDERVGFEIRGILPSGASELIFEAQLSTTKCIRLLRVDVQVARSYRPRWLGGGDWTELMFLQMPLHMVHPPHSLKTERFPRVHLNSKTPRVAIVTPSYRQGEFIEQTLRSVLDQSIKCVYVVQDACSDDRTIHVAQQFVDRLRFVAEQDKGQADAIQRGFHKTAGQPHDLMAWLNSDDFYLPGTLAYVADYFAAHPDVDVIYGHRIVVDEQSREIGRWFLPPHDDEVLRLNDFVPQETLFWRRRIWDKVGGIDPSFKFAMDWDLLLRFQAAGAKIVRVPYFLACFRVHAAQKTSAQMESVGQAEIDFLRRRTFGRTLRPDEIENNPCLIRYLRKSAWIEFLWRRFRIRHP
jgi:Glycosyltransferases, probably involved in cell wall biogenesis